VAVSGKQGGTFPSSGSLLSDTRGVRTLAREELFVSALRDDAAFFKDEDAVGLSYGQTEPLSKSCNLLMAAVLRFSEAVKSKTRACWQFLGTPSPLI
jgi:hypothetical protein